MIDIAGLGMRVLVACEVTHPNSSRKIAELFAPSIIEYDYLQLVVRIIKSECSKDSCPYYAKRLIVRRYKNVHRGPVSWITSQGHRTAPERAKRLKISKYKRDECVEFRKQEDDDENRIPLMVMPGTCDSFIRLDHAVIAVTQRAEDGDCHQHQRHNRRVRSTIQQQGSSDQRSPENGLLLPCQRQDQQEAKSKHCHQSEQAAHDADARRGLGSFCSEPTHACTSAVAEKWKTRVREGTFSSFVLRRLNCFMLWVVRV